MWEDFPGSRDATAYWSAEHTKCRKDKAAKIFCCSHGTPAGIVPHVKGIFPYSVRAQNPRTSPIKGTLKEQKKKGGLGRKEREEKVKRDPTIVELQARVLLHLRKDSKLKSTATLLGISFLLFPCIFILWVVKETEVYPRGNDTLLTLYYLFDVYTCTICVIIYSTLSTQQAPTPTTSAVTERLTPDSPVRRKGKATAGRSFGRDILSSPEEEAEQRPAKRQRRYHIITADSDDDDNSAEIPVSKPMKSADPSLSSSI
ncbi:hypothetical protein GQ457_16G017870 [Hibiscus cannabinus]